MQADLPSVTAPPTASTSFPPLPNIPPSAKSTFAQTLSHPPTAQTTTVNHDTQVFSFPVPPKYQPLLSHPTLSRHVRFNHQGDIIKARLCHDLNNLPYDREDIMKVPFNRVYKREKLLLIDNPANREMIIRQSLTNPAVVNIKNSREVVAQSVARIKKICANQQKPVVLDFTYDNQRKDRCNKILRTLSTDHPLKKFKTRNINSHVLSERRDEIIEYETEKNKVLDLANWEREANRKILNASGYRV